MPQEINWLQAGIGFFTGGACGAFIKQYFDNRRNRIQPIRIYVSTKPIYNSVDNPLIASEIVLKGEGKDYKFSSLFIGNIVIVNTGSIDFKDFDFGITCKESTKFIQVKPIGKDRHHKANILSEPTLDNLVNSFDVKLTPFNRKDAYTVDFLITSNEKAVLEKDIDVSSPYAVKWNKVSLLDEIIYPDSISPVSILDALIKNLVITTRRM